MDNDELNELDDDNIIQLTDEFGETVDFEFLDLIEYESEQYVVLLPVEDNNENEAEEDSVVVILKLNDSDLGDDEVYTAVEDQSVIDAVFNIFKEKFQDEFTFTADEDNNEDL